MCCDLLELFAGVADGRVGPGRDHPVAAVLALAAAAVVAGMRGYTAITGWVADVPPAILADVFLRGGAAPAPPPSKTTIWRVLTDADPGALDAAAGTWLMNLAGLTAPGTAGLDAGEEAGSRALMQVRLDGKAIRGAKDADGTRSGCSRPWSARTPPPRWSPRRTRSAGRPMRCRWPRLSSARSTWQARS